LADTVWATSCQSWYKRDDGRITALYPYNGRTWRRRHRKLRRDHFEIRQAGQGWPGPSGRIAAEPFSSTA